MRQRLLRAALVIVGALAALASAAQAQTGTTVPPAQPVNAVNPANPLGSAAPQSSTPATDVNRARTDADETFDLDIGERRITRQHLEASTSVELGERDARHVRLRVGVMLGADRIDVLLRNVRGHVRFRGSLESLRQRLDERHGQNPTNPAAVPSTAAPSTAAPSTAPPSTRADDSSP